MLTNPIDCPVCGGQHQSAARLGQYPILACTKVTPVGNTLTFMQAGVVVVGAGLLADQKPAVEPTAAQLQARVDSLKNAKASATAVAPTGKSVDELKKELAALEA